MIGFSPLSSLRNACLRPQNVRSAHYDAIISGGGLVGGAMGAALSKSNALSDRKVLLLEGAPAKEYNFPEDFSNRVTALNNSTRSLFERLGVWSVIESVRVKTVRGMHVWDEKNVDNSTLVTFEAEFPQPGHFYITENDAVIHSLFQVVNEAKNVEVWNGKGVASCKFEDGKTVVSLKDGTELSTDLLIGADGVNSSVRKAMKSTQYMSKSYDQFGVVGVLHFEEEIPNEFAWQKFLPSGPIALLPLSVDKSSLVWTLPTAQAQKVIRSDPTEIVQALNKALSGPSTPSVKEPMPKIVKIDKVAGFPLGFGHSSRYCEPGMVLVGDAAHRVHPLAGQGVNLGFSDVETLVECLEGGVLQGKKFADYDVLLDYETRQQRNNVPMMLGIDFLQQIYCADYELVKNARSIGVKMVNSNPLIKKLISSFAA